jgi:hypothetical protein
MSDDAHTITIEVEALSPRDIEFIYKLNEQYIETGEPLIAVKMVNKDLDPVYDPDEVIASLFEASNKLGW